MSKKKKIRRKPKKKARKIARSKSNNAIGRLWQFICSVWKFLAVISIIIGLVVAVLALFPDVYVYSVDTMKPARTINSPFIIRNDSFLPISELRFEYLFRSVESKGPDWHNLFTNTLTRTDGLRITRLRKGESTTAICVFPMALNKPITMADVEISIFFKYLFWSKNERFRFITLRNNDGYLYWTPKSMADQ